MQILKLQNFQKTTLFHLQVHSGHWWRGTCYRGRHNEESPQAATQLSPALVLPHFSSKLSFSSSKELRCDF